MEVEIELEFKANTAYSEEYGDGTWTTIYDEGFLVYFQEIEFFSYSKYVLNSSNIE